MLAQDSINVDCIRKDYRIHSELLVNCIVAMYLDPNVTRAQQTLKHQWRSDCVVVNAQLDWDSSTRIEIVLSYLGLIPMEKK